MSQLQPTLSPPDALPLIAPRRALGGRFAIPGWLSLLLRNPKSRFGLSLVLFMIVIALIAPLISVSDRTGFDVNAVKQSRSWHHLFGTTDQGSDIFSQVVLGAGRSLLLGALGAVRATALASRAGIPAGH